MSAWPRRVPPHTGCERGLNSPAAVLNTPRQSRDSSLPAKEQLRALSPGASRRSNNHQSVESGEPSPA
jgi:hypothetical protein